MDSKIDMKNLKFHELYEKYSTGQLEKSDYIEIMHKKHQILFDYFDYIKETDVQSITIDNDKMYITVKGSGIKLLIDRFDKRFIPIEMLNFRSIEAEDGNMLIKLASNCQMILDIGANVGWYSLHFDKLPNVRKIYAFEPIPYTFNYLTEHLKMNGAEKVSTFNFGFSDTSDEKIFYWTNAENGAASMVNIRERSEIEEVKCKVVPLDDFMKSRDDMVDLIKCDVEGAELFVFKGGIETIKRCKPIIFTEMLRKWSAKFNYHPDDIIKLFEEIGYNCYGYINHKFDRVKSVGPELETTNFFFFHGKKHKNLIEDILKKN